LSSGDYVYGVDGEPVLESTFVTSTQILGNAKQSIEIESGLDRVTLFSGFNDALTSKGKTDANSVTVYSWMSTDEVVAIINAHMGAGTVTVIVNTTSAETLEASLAANAASGGPWNLDVAAGTGQLAYHYQTQAFSGTVSTEEDSAVLQAFLQVESVGSGTWDYSVDATGTPVLTLETALIEGTFAWSDWMKTAQLQVGTESANLQQLHEAILTAQVRAEAVNLPRLARDLEPLPIDWAETTNILRQMLSELSADQDLQIAVSTVGVLPVWALSELVSPEIQSTFEFTDSIVDADDSIQIFYNGLYRSVHFDGTDITSLDDAQSDRSITGVDRADILATIEAVKTQVELATGLDAVVSYGPVEGHDGNVWQVMFNARLDSVLQLSTGTNLIPVLASGSVDNNDAKYVGDETGRLSLRQSLLNHSDAPAGTLQIFANGTTELSFDEQTTKQALAAQLDALNLALTYQIDADNDLSTDWTLILDTPFGDNAISVQAINDRATSPLTISSYWQEGTLGAETVVLQQGFFDNSKVLLPSIAGATNVALSETADGSATAITLDDQDLVATEASIAAALGLTDADISLAYGSGIWEVSFDTGPAPEVFLNYDLDGLPDQVEKLSKGFYDIAAVLDTNTLLLPNINSVTSLLINDVTITTSDGVDAFEFAATTENFSGNDITVNYSNELNGWIVDFGETAPNLTMNYSLISGPGVDDTTAASRDLANVVKDYAHQAVTIPLGFSEVQVTYNNESAVVSLADFQLSGNETPEDFPKQYAATDALLATLFSGITGLAGAEINAVIEEDYTGFLQIYIAMPAGQEDYYQVQISPVVTAANAAVVQPFAVTTSGFVLDATADRAADASAQSIDLTGVAADSALSLSVNGETVYVYSTATAEDVAVALESLQTVEQASVSIESSVWTINLYDPRHDASADYPIIQWLEIDSIFDNADVADRKSVV
jgi:hypothetical protein